MRKESPCDACLCNYCRWRGTDNCLRCENGSCLKCGDLRRQKKPIYECSGYCERGASMIGTDCTITREEAESEISVGLECFDYAG